ncbi:hypothetical protein SeMB42_g03492 [Synchytrium endobioticum]|uniref:Signal peptidase complex subunit 1 n=1 Tax=Synchytrium endobioticum TaxID=286115 RepID=A0A507DEZ4_9FUNG|nr:hypothetical protein SeMB42_g03492 [Synchytrium endobioticum]TPX50269.1 hypothetical protein SeLEV6574_g00992 [Synchytrium endobioticum]
MASLLQAPIDFEGQRLAEQYAQIILTATGVIAFIAGFALQNLSLLMTIMLSGLVVAFAVALPPWPIYNKFPVMWLPKTAKADGLTVEQPWWKSLLG